MRSVRCPPVLLLCVGAGLGQHTGLLVSDSKPGVSLVGAAEGLRDLV